MERSKVVVHCVVKNEENFVWYAINSVLPFVDKIMVWDTGSEDKTVEIIKSIKSPKIDFREVGNVTPETLTAMRNGMLKDTDKKKYDWLLILDGDEIWKEKELLAMIKRASAEKPEAVAVKTVNFVSDIYHALPDSAGQYRILGQKGPFNLRLISLHLPNLVVENPYPYEAYKTNGIALQDLPAGKLVLWKDIEYFHASHLQRSSLDKTTLKRNLRRKLELGNRIQKINLPEIFFNKRPMIVPDVTHKMSSLVWVKSAFVTIPKRLKRAVANFKNAAG